MSRDDDIVDRINGLSDDAFYLASQYWFGRLVLWKPVLAVASNDRQETAFEELMKCGFVYLDTERGQVGFRSTDHGRIAHTIIAQHAKQNKPAKAQGQPS